LSTDRGTHPEHRVCPKSRLPPALFHVSLEARREASRVYKLRTFDSATVNSKQRYIYFNPSADIIYFGVKNCLATMMRVFMQETKDGKEIPQVAMVVEKRCNAFLCRHDMLTRRYNGYIDEVGILRGINSKTWGDSVINRLWTGCPGLKEVFFVVKDTVWDIDAGAMDASVGFRPATTDGITEDQQEVKELIEIELLYVKWGLSLIGIDDYKWSQEAPNFDFVSLNPIHVGPSDDDDRMHYTMLIEQEGIKRLEQTNWSFLKRLESRTGCHIVLPKRPFPRRQPVELGIFGTNADIEKAKQAIKEKASTYGQIQEWRSDMIKKSREQPRSRPSRKTGHEESKMLLTSI